MLTTLAPPTPTATPTAAAPPPPGLALAASVHQRALRLADRHGERGQGTVEYVALAMLVAALMAGVVLVAGKAGGADIANAIARKIKGAIDGAGKR